jgi:hypothetical protein
LSLAAARWIAGEVALNEELAEAHWREPSALGELKTTEGLGPDRQCRMGADGDSRLSFVRSCQRGRVEVPFCGTSSAGTQRAARQHSPLAISRISMAVAVPHGGAAIACLRDMPAHSLKL